MNQNVLVIPNETVYSDERVLTTAQLSEFFECKPQQIYQNFSYSKQHFVEGKHYYVATGDELKKLRGENLEMQISPKSRAFYFWTKRGVARHAKMLNSNRAWELFELLEDAYFNPKIKTPTHAEVFANEKFAIKTLSAIPIERQIEWLMEIAKMTEDAKLRDGCLRKIFFILN